MPCRSPGPYPGVRLRGLARGGSRPTPRGEVEGSGQGEGSPGPHPGGRLRGLAGGVSRPTPGGGGIPACTGADPPPHSRQLLLWAVDILLECILV